MFVVVVVMVMVMVMVMMVMMVYKHPWACVRVGVRIDTVVAGEAWDVR